MLYLYILLTDIYIQVLEASSINTAIDRPSGFGNYSKLFNYIIDDEGVQTIENIKSFCKYFLCLIFFMCYFTWLTLKSYLLSFLNYGQQ